MNFTMLFIPFSPAKLMVIMKILARCTHLEKAFRETYVYNGCYSPHRKKIFGERADDNDYGQFVVFSQNHDHIGNRMLGDRLTETLNDRTTETCSFNRFTVALCAYAVHG